MRGPWGPQTNISYFVCVVLVDIYLFHASWGLHQLDFSDYNMVQLDIVHFEAHFDNLAAFWPFQGPLGVPRDPRPISFSLYLYS
jgi:hypothetical protein